MIEFYICFTEGRKMNRKTVSGMMVTLLLIGMLTLAFNVQPVKAEPTTWTVDDDGPADFSSIQEAINSPVVKDGDTIFVYNGTYYENLVINKNNLTLLGEDKDTTIIDGGGTGTVVEITAKDAKINGFTIRNGGPTYFGISIYYSSNNKLTGNNITNNYGSIHLFYSSNNTVSNNNVTNNYDGISIYNAFNNTLSDNSITNNFNYGIHLSDSSNNIISSNTVTNNYWYGIYLGNASSNILFGNIVSNNGEDGIILEVGSNNNSLSSNNITNNDSGITLYSSSNNTISGNNIANNSNYGIWLFSSLSCSVSDNSANDNLVGILLEQSFNCFVNSNDVTNNECGISLYCSSGCSVLGNNANNNLVGIELYYFSDNTIYHNNFINNTIQAQAINSVNIWDDGYPSGGNYWSDYTGVDEFNGPGQNISGSDGIGDTPYDIDFQNKDNYPLMEPWMPAGVVADLVRRRAWSEHHHYDISKDEDEHQTLYAKVKNLGNQTVWVKAAFNITKDDGFSTVIESEPLLIEMNAIVELSADFGPLTNADAGKYYVSATCWYSQNKMVWRQGEKEKTFKFRIVP